MVCTDKFRMLLESCQSLYVFDSRRQFFFIHDDTGILQRFRIKWYIANWLDSGMVIVTCKIYTQEQADKNRILVISFVNHRYSK